MPLCVFACLLACLLACLFVCLFVCRQVYICLCWSLRLRMCNFAGGCQAAAGRIHPSPPGDLIEPTESPVALDLGRELPYWFFSRGDGDPDLGGCCEPNIAPHASPTTAPKALGPARCCSGSRSWCVLTTCINTQILGPQDSSYITPNYELYCLDHSWILETNQELSVSLVGSACSRRVRHGTMCIYI